MYRKSSMIFWTGIPQCLQRAITPCPSVSAPAVSLANSHRVDLLLGVSPLAVSSTSQWSLVEAAGKSAVPEQSAEDLLVRRALSSDDEDEDPVGLAEGGASQDVDVGDTVANPLGDV